jgi:RHS repeat-associated protein
VALKNRYYSINGQVIAERTPGGGRVDYGTDALGSVTLNASTGGSTRYSPYGEQGSAPAGVSLGWVGAWGYRPTGRAVASHYVRARHYASPQGRWTSVDLVWPRERAYGYAWSSPTVYVDSSGTQVRTSPFLAASDPRRRRSPRGTGRAGSGGSAGIGSVQRVQGTEFVNPAYNSECANYRTQWLFENACKLLQMCWVKQKCREQILNCIKVDLQISSVRAHRLIDTMLTLCNGKRKVEISLNGLDCIRSPGICGLTQRKNGVCYIAICERAWLYHACDSPLQTMYHEMSHCHGTLDLPADQAELAGNCIDSAVRLYLGPFIRPDMNRTESLG